MALATVDDFEARHGGGDSRVSALLEDASALILSELARSNAKWITDPEAQAPQIVKAICVEVAYRAWSNPDRLSSERLGEYVASWQGSASETTLQLTQQELRTLRRAAADSSFSAVRLDACMPFAQESDSLIRENDLFPIQE
jgi:hypothetical protein